MRKTIIYLFLFVAGTCSYGQKKSVTVADYDKWYDLMPGPLSPDATWASFQKLYDAAPDTLVVIHTGSGKIYEYPEIGNPTFSPDSKYMVARHSEKGLLFLDLASGREEWITGVTDYEFDVQRGFICILQNNDGQRLTVRSYGGNEYHIPGVLSFSINGGKIAFTTGARVGYLDFSKGFSETTIIEQQDANFTRLTWNNNDGIGFLEELPAGSLRPDPHKLGYYNLRSRQLLVLDPGMAPVLSGRRIVVPRKGSPIHFGKGHTVFFYTAAPRGKFETESPQVWDSATPAEPLIHQLRGEPSYRAQLKMWEPSKQTVSDIATDSLPVAVLLPDKMKVIVYDDLKYLPNTGQDPEVDLHLVDVTTGERNLIVEKTGNQLEMIGSSPKSSYINYFKDGHWWCFDTAEKKRYNMTARLNVPLINTDKQYPGYSAPYDSPGWLADEKSFIVYDDYDVWLVSPKGNNVKRVTNGRETKTRYRVMSQLYETQFNFDEFFIRDLDLKKGIILHAVDCNSTNTYVLWTKSGLTPFVSADARFYGLRKGAQHIYSYVEETAATPPVLKVADVRKPGARVIYASNPSHSKYSWGKVETIKYETPAGETLKGLLYYPANYEPGKKYPMVVHVYEKQSQNVHSFQRPTLYQGIGFSPADYFLDGYLVFMPDIRYREGDPGVSALECVTAAVNKVKSLGVVNEQGIGLIGQSFGGYETLFIITQTPMFAAAISGSGISDPANLYFRTTDIHKSNMFRYEVQQFRMGFSPFENREAYLRNSPLENAAGIETPLLTWAGKKDRTVPWSESEQMHYAMRRLGKKNIFLVYEHEGHIILTPEAQKDVSTRTKNWFDHYLKGETNDELP